MLQGQSGYTQYFYHLIDSKSRYIINIETQGITCSEAQGQVYKFSQTNSVLIRFKNVTLPAQSLKGQG